MALLAAGAMHRGPRLQGARGPLPTAWSQSSGEGVDSRPADLDLWWSKFEDQKLDELITRAFQTNLDLQAAEARIREARGIRAVAFSGYYPSVNASGAYTRQRLAENGLASNGFGGAPPASIPM